MSRVRVESFVSNMELVQRDLRAAFHNTGVRRTASMNTQSSRSLTRADRWVVLDESCVPEFFAFRFSPILVITTEAPILLRFP